jgi:hypothetical protein
VHRISAANFLNKLHEESCRRFEEFRKVENEIHLLTSTFSFDVVKAPYNLQLELNEEQVIKNQKRNIILWSVPTRLECYVVTNIAISKTWEGKYYQFLNSYKL